LKFQRRRFAFAHEKASASNDVQSSIGKRYLGDHTAEVHPDGAVRWGNHVCDSTNDVHGDPFLAFFQKVHCTATKHHVLFACTGAFHFAADETGAEPEAEGAQEEGKNGGE